MNFRCACHLLAAAAMLAALSPAHAVTIDWVPVGDPGNSPDVTGYGEVDYSYTIAKYDVTVGQYTAFLNAVAQSSDPYDLYVTTMSTDLTVAGIARSGSSGSYSYSVIGSADHPITYVSWGNAARFANWMENGQPTGSEGPGTTETGSYTLNGAMTDAALNAVGRNLGATYVIPTENEWYKAAYYNPNTATYFQYPFSNNTVPTSAPPGTTPNSGNFVGPGGYAVTGSGTLDPSQNYLTDVGAYAASASPYGAFDMGGNVSQWNDAIISGTQRGTRGGSWDANSIYMSSGFRNGNVPTFRNQLIGFRVETVSVPEPGTVVLAAFGFATLMLMRLRKARWAKR